MTQKQQIQLFEEKKVRTVWDDEKEGNETVINLCGVEDNESENVRKSSFLQLYRWKIANN